mmetsp:Transcript_3394/g.8320  ORF Transcript_3394/g.8320 Transcript_3394/m.8320 type:complete len:169 (+) Transcript_3394:802-1308(+)
MGYRCGWCTKDANQTNVLEVRLHRWAFDWILCNASLASQQQGRATAVVQWDPERGLGGESGKASYTHSMGEVRAAGSLMSLCLMQLVILAHRPTLGVPAAGGRQVRSIQIGLRDTAVQRYASEFIVSITDVSGRFREIGQRLQVKDTEGVAALLPVELAYPMPEGAQI